MSELILRRTKLWHYLLTRVIKRFKLRSASGEFTNEFHLINRLLGKIFSRSKVIYIIKYFQIRIRYRIEYYYPRIELFD